MSSLAWLVQGIKKPENTRFYAVFGLVLQGRLELPTPCLKGGNKSCVYAALRILDIIFDNISV